MVAGSDTEPRVPVDDAAVLGRDRHVSEKAADESGADRDSAHCADHRLAAVDHVVDDIARLLPLPGACLEIFDVLPNDREIATGRKYLAGAGDDRGIDARVAIDVAPDLAELTVQCLIGCVHAAVLHRDAENLRVRAIEFEPRIAGIEVGHRHLPCYRITMRQRDQSASLPHSLIALL